MATAQEIALLKQFLEKYLTTDACPAQKNRLKFAVNFSYKSLNWCIDPELRFVSFLTKADGFWASFFILSTDHLSPALESTIQLIIANAPKEGYLLLGGVDFKLVPDTAKYLSIWAAAKSHFKISSEKSNIWTPTKHSAPPTQNEDKSVSLVSLALDDAEIVNDHWKYKSDHSLRTMQSCIKDYPSTGLKSSDTNTLISWAVSRSDGAISNLFTKPEARGKNYATCVIADMVQKMSEWTKNEFEPYCYIVQGNVASEKCLTRCGFQPTAQVSWVILEWD